MAKSTLINQLPNKPSSTEMPKINEMEMEMQDDAEITEVIHEQQNNTINVLQEQINALKNELSSHQQLKDTTTRQPTKEIEVVDKVQQHTTNDGSIINRHNIHSMLDNFKLTDVKFFCAIVLLYLCVTSNIFDTFLQSKFEGTKYVFTIPYIKAFILGISIILYQKN
jgi:hypothetical protein